LDFTRGPKVEEIARPLKGESPWVFTSIGSNKNLLDGFRTLDVGYWRLVLSMSLLVQIYYQGQGGTRAVVPDFGSTGFTASLVNLLRFV
jgi:hypothetical protein